MSIRTATHTSALHGNTVYWPWLVIAIGWGVALVATFSSQDWVLNHHVLIEGGRFPLVVAGLIFLLAWQLMTVTMMLPASVSMLALFQRANGRDRGGRAATGAFLAGYLLTWSAFGIVAFTGDIQVHRLVDHWSWLADHPWTIAAATLVTAGVFQFMPVKERYLARCRAPRAVLAQRYRPGQAGAWTLGLVHGKDCLGYCWALMLVMFGLGAGNVLWMAGLGGLVFLEKSASFQKYLVPGVGIILLAWGFLVLAHPGWLPSVLTGLA